ncbi:MAG: enolase C-terminal domain-like protein, partial [Gammaproteobacteria bacterium]
MSRASTWSRRSLLGAAAAGACVAAAPAIVRAQRPLTLSFLTIPDPDGWHPSLRLKGDWLIFEISDGIVSGFGEASHSRDDEACRAAATRLFAEHYTRFEPTLATLAEKEAELAGSAPDFVTATALSGLNQALYELIAKREQVPVWQLFRDRPGVTSLPLYATINRALKERSLAEYLDIVALLDAQGFATFKCAPFEAVDSPENAYRKSEAGRATLTAIREGFADIGIRVDFHERFSPESFRRLLSDLEPLRLDWIEEPFAMGPDYADLQRATELTVAAGELFWGRAGFERIVDNGWADVIMPDVKHVGGFGPLLDVMRMAQSRAEVSPHNPSGPISTAASLHAVAVLPAGVRSL